jgi:transposase-like protein
MSPVTEEDGMAERACQAGNARTTDRTSARRLGTELSTCGRRRRWTAEQKHKIVAEGMEPGVSVAMVAGRHGISSGQFYAWRQQLLLRGALDAGADSVPNLASLDAATSAPRVEPAIPVEMRSVVGLAASFVVSTKASLMKSITALSCGKAGPIPLSTGRRLLTAFFNDDIRRASAKECGMA